MDKSTSDMQATIDNVSWYHEFDFGGGLMAKSNEPNVDGHRIVWRFIEDQLDQFDFRGKTVLDVGCWDGYWSFFAERQGAQSVLASDDVSQNWANGAGVRLAKQLLGSSIQINQQVSIYELPSLNQKFDVILCLGVYYHLYAPFFALSQLRHCCHEETIVFLEGDMGRSFTPTESRFQFDDSSKAAFVPSPQAMNQIVRAAYFDVASTNYLTDYLKQQDMWSKVRGYFRDARRVVRAILPTGRASIDRCFLKCTPFEGVNGMHAYRPPFGLSRYDQRYSARPPEQHEAA